MTPLKRETKTDTRQDLTMHSDNELSLMVFNDEMLYRMRRNERELVDYLKESFKFTDDQLDMLKRDLEDDAKEF